MTWTRHSGAIENRPVGYRSYGVQHASSLAVQLKRYEADGTHTDRLPLDDRNRTGSELLTTVGTGSHCRRCGLLKGQSLMAQCDQTLSIGQAARLLKVSTSTMQRLCIRGTVAFECTGGGHRRIRSAVIAGILEKSRGQLIPLGIMPSNVQPSRQQLVEWILAGAEHELLGWLTCQLDTYRIITKLENDLYGAALEITDLRYRGEISVSQASLAQITVRRLLSALSAQIELPTQNEIAVGGAPIEAYDSHALKLVQIGLRLGGFNALDLGELRSAQALIDAATQLNASLIWFAQTHLYNLPQTMQWYRSLAAIVPRGMRVIIGGGGITPLIRRQLPDFTYYDSVCALVAAESNRLPEYRDLRKLADGTNLVHSGGLHSPHNHILPRRSV